MKDWEIELLNNMEKEFGSIPPKWVVYPEFHPVSMGWRMGGGENYAIAWTSWWDEQNFNFEEQVAYFKQYATPKAWLKRLVYTLYEDELVKEFGKDGLYGLNEELSPYFKKLEKLGFGSYEEWEEDYNSERWD